MQRGCNMSNIHLNKPFQVNNMHVSLLDFGSPDIYINEKWKLLVLYWHPPKNQVVSREQSKYKWNPQQTEATPWCYPAINNCRLLWTYSYFPIWAHKKKSEAYNAISSARCRAFCITSLSWLLHRPLYIVPISFPECDYDIFLSPSYPI